MDTQATSPASAATGAGLIYVCDSTPGIRRVAQASSFHYMFDDERPVTDPAELERIARLAIPPAYHDVWICGDSRGHLQATGRDARGRKQYRYHAEWRLARDGAKFERMLAFGESLPRLRRRLKHDLHLSGLPREKVLATLVSILDATLMRVGNAEYARENASYGLTTLRNRHVQFIAPGRLLLKFRGKGGVPHEVSIDDTRLVRLVRRCHQLPGQHLFQYVDDAGVRRPIDSDQLNEYLKDAMGEEFTAKDFRTWGATVRTVVVLHAVPLPVSGSERALTACIVEAVKAIAAELGNTPAVCRKSYINPAVFDAWRTGALHRLIAAPLSSDPSKAETKVLAFLRRHASMARAPRSRPVTRARVARVLESQHQAMRAQ